MTRPRRGLVVAIAAAALAGAALLGLLLLMPGPWASILALVDDDTETVEVTDYSAPRDDDPTLVDDRIEDKVPAFDPSTSDRRPLGGWSINASAAVIRLDVPITRPDREPELLALHPSYAEAAKVAGGRLLPSVNLIDGKAKQFDDGLYAAIDRAYYLGHGEAMKGHRELLRRIHARVIREMPADNYLAAGLSLGSKPVPTTPEARSAAAAFLSNPLLSRPIGFYTWDPALSECFRVLRYFARPIESKAVAVEIAEVLRKDPTLRDDYVRASTFYAGLTNPLVGRTPADLIDGPPIGPGDVISLFPPSTTRETELFEKLFPTGLPPGADLMRELIAAIRSGRVDLKPGANSGWYDHQVYALEALLLPEKGDGADRLLLTKAYKKRMLAAFQALITKRRETHARQAKTAAGGIESPPQELEDVRPRLRLEPNPAYYLRTARSYAFLANFLEATLGEATLQSLKGLRESGERGPDLHAELRSMRDLFYGLYLLDAEDIGLTPANLDGEGVDREAAEKLASDWLGKLGSDPDLAEDTRVAAPVYGDPRSGSVRLWLTLGVRLAPLEARYARPPSVRLAEATGDWKPLGPGTLRTAEYLIPVDEFAEVELRDSRVLTRAELRAICDRMKTKEAILGALARP